MFRALLIALVIHGLVPSAAELVETLVHLVTTGHVAHDAAHHETSPDDEHGCGPIAHHCVCCPSQPLVAQAPSALSAIEGVVAQACWPQERFVPDAPRACPFRPPIEA